MRTMEKMMNMQESRKQLALESEHCRAKEQLRVSKRGLGRGERKTGFRGATKVYGLKTTGRNGRHTEDKLLRRRQHVQTECDFILISLALQPSETGGDYGSFGRHCAVCRGIADQVYFLGVS